MRINKKKVAIITGSLMTGGAEAMVAQLAINIDKSRFEVQVICICKSVNSPMEQLLMQEGINVTFLDKENGPDIRTFIKIGKKLNEFKPNIVHTHLSGAIYSYPWLFFNNCKMIHTLHTLPEKEFSKFTQRLLKVYYNTGKATLVTISPENHKSAVSHFSLRPSMVKMIYNPVDIKKFFKDINKQDDNFIFINVGRQDINKNQAQIISALKALKEVKSNIKLYLVGDGDQNKNLRLLAKELNVENDVIFPGIVNNVEDYLAKADVYVQSSHFEGLPLSILEAMAAKLPIISTNVGGVKDIVKNNGILVEDNNLNELINAMRSLMTNEEVLKIMSAESYKEVEIFDSQLVANKYSELYDELSR